MLVRIFSLEINMIFAIFCLAMHRELFLGGSDPVLFPCNLYSPKNFRSRLALLLVLAVLSHCPNSLLSACQGISVS
jgi:hypothetical protein